MPSTRSQQTFRVKAAGKKPTKAEQYNLDFTKVITKVAKTRKGAFTVDDVIAKIGTPPQGGKAIGALMHAAVLRLGLVHVGEQKAKSESRRGALNKVWKAPAGFKKYS